MAAQRICENDKHEIKSNPVGEDKRSSCALGFWRSDNLLGWLRLGQIGFVRLGVDLECQLEVSMVGG
ncbi:unnamed protein product [Prunus brigantina]